MTRCHWTSENDRPHRLVEPCCLAALSNQASRVAVEGIETPFRIGLRLIVQRSNGTRVFGDRTFQLREGSQVEHFDPLFDGRRGFGRVLAAKSRLSRPRNSDSNPVRTECPQAARHAPTFVRQVVLCMMSLFKVVADASWKTTATVVRRCNCGASRDSMIRLIERNVIAKRVVQEISEIGRTAVTRRLPRHLAKIPPLFCWNKRDGRANSPCVVDR